MFPAPSRPDLSCLRKTIRVLKQPRGRQRQGKRHLKKEFAHF